MKRVVAVGGGTGMPVLIKALLNIVPHVDAIITVADDGGSSGRLRQELRVPPPGDSRNCLVAMGDNCMLSRLFQHRFPEGDLKGHALGNLIITALTEMTGDFSQALLLAGKLVNARGRVMPPSLVPLTLVAEVADFNSGASSSGLVDEKAGLQSKLDRKVVGQCNVANRLHPLAGISVDPADAPAFSEATAALYNADVIILGPGSLFTSIIANLLVKDVAKAVRDSAAKKIFLCNITIQPGETDGFTAADHVSALLRFAGQGCCDLAVTSNTRVSDECLAELKAAKSAPVVVDGEEIAGLNVAHKAADLTDEVHPTHHDSDKLTAFFQEIL